MRTRRNTKRPNGTTPKLTSGRDGNDKSEVALVDHACRNNGPYCEPVTAPKNVASVLCGRCAQKLVGSEALPPPPLTDGQKKERFARFLASKKSPTPTQESGS